MLNSSTMITPALLNNNQEKRVWGPWATVGFSLVILVVFFIAQTLVIAIPAMALTFAHLGQIGTATPEDLVQMVMDELTARLGLLQSIATIASGIIATGVILLVIRARKGLGIPEYLGLKRLNIKALWLAFGAVIVCIAFSSVIQMLTDSESNSTLISDIYDTSIWPPLFWIAVIIFAPLFEEALFRGFLFEGLRRSAWGLYGAVMITAFIWALLHGIQYDLGGILWIFILGIVMGIVRWKTGTIWSTFIMHAIVNLIATISIAFNLNI